MAIRVGVNMLQFCSVSNSLSHTTLSNIVRGTYFSKELCARLYCVIVMILHTSANVHAYEYITLSDVLLWTPIYKIASVGHSSRTKTHQICEDIKCILEDIPRAMED